MSAYAGPHDTELTPDDDCMFRFLSWWFAGCDRGALELCWRDPPTGRWDLVKRFGLDDINAAVRFAAETNARPGCSVYFRPATVRFESLNTTDDDVVQIPGPWTDCDTAESVEHMLAANPVPSAQVVTGRCPELRAQFYYKSSKPILGEASRQLNRQVHALSGGDGAVTNPSTLMRLPGSIAWPWKPGREIELTEWLTPDGGGDVFAPDALHAGLPAVEDGDAPGRPINGNATEELLNPIRALIGQIKAGPLWHAPVLRLVGMLVARGTPSCVIEAMAPELTWPGYTVEQTRAEIRVMIDGARRRGFAPDEDDVAESDDLEDVMNVPPPEAPAGIRILTEDDLDNMPDPVWLIDERLVADSLCVLYGPWGSFKSFVALHIALCLVAGLPFYGQKTVRSDVLYIAGEGAAGVKKRLAAWKTHHGIARVPGFRVVPVAINLLDRAEAERLIVAVLEAQKADGFNPKLVIVDTLHRAMAGGDENAAKEMGIVLANGAHIQRRLGCVLMPVHHSGKEFERGMRGSSGLPGGTDTILRMTRNGTDDRGVLLVEKQKDGEDGQEHHLVAQVIDLPPATGSIKPRSSLVLVATEAAAGGRAKRAQPKGDAGVGFRSLADLIVAEGAQLPGTDGFPTTSTQGVTELAWRREFYRRLSDREQNAKRMAFSRMMTSLRDAGLVGLCDGLVWLVRPDEVSP